MSHGEILCHAGMLAKCRWVEHKQQQQHDKSFIDHVNG